MQPPKTDQEALERAVIKLPIDSLTRTDFAASHCIFCSVFSSLCCIFPPAARLGFFVGHDRYHTMSSKPPTLAPTQ